MAARPLFLHTVSETPNSKQHALDANRGCSRTHLAVL
jgi:hypothetical protein